MVQGCCPANIPPTRHRVRLEGLASLVHLVCPRRPAWLSPATMRACAVLRGVTREPVPPFCNWGPSEWFLTRGSYSKCCCERDLRCPRSHQGWSRCGGQRALLSCAGRCGSSCGPARGRRGRRAARWSGYPLLLARRCLSPALSILRSLSLIVAASFASRVLSGFLRSSLGGSERGQLWPPGTLGRAALMAPAPSGSQSCSRSCECSRAQMSSPSRAPASPSPGHPGRG